MLRPFGDFARRGSEDVPSTSSRMSLLPIRLSSLNMLRQDALEKIPPIDKPVLLTLKASSRTFIDSVISDGISNAPLYILKTMGSATTITRNSSSGGNMQFATIRWPKTVPTRVNGQVDTDGVEIQMGNARYIGGDKLLQFGQKPNSARKFVIPNYSNHLKWKRRGDSYWCTTAKINGPVATLDIAKGKNPFKLTIYETLRDKYDSRSVLYHQGVYILLLDYLIVTAMLLVTDIQEWMLVRKHREKNIIIPNPRGENSDTVEASSSQLRKIMYGEPIYPKLSGGSSSNLSVSDSHSILHAPYSSRRPSHPHGPHSHSRQTNTHQSMLSLSTDSDFNDDDDDDDITEAAVTHTRAGSPTGSNYPPSISHAPSHSYIDPSFYRNNIPPVPPLPLLHTKSDMSLRESWSGTSVSSSSSLSRAFRELPRPPSQTTNSSPLPARVVTIQRSEASNQQDVSSLTATSFTQAAGLGRVRSMTSSGRPLPRPLPSVPNSTARRMGSVRRARSHATLVEDVSILAPLAPPVLPLVYSHPPTQQRSRPSPQRLLPQTPMALTMDPLSPHPEEMQEELRVAAATMKMLRQRPQATPIQLSSASPRKNGQNGDEGGDAQWLQVSGQQIQPLPAAFYDLPPPAYSESFEGKPQA